MLAAGLLSTSCNDFLTEDPKGQLDPSTYFCSESSVNSAVYALYSKVNATQIYTNMLYPQWQGDDITANPGSNKQACAELDAFSASSNNKGIRDSWSANYKVIKAANNIVNNVKTDDGTYAATAKNAIAQAKFWRAVSYYYLVRLYGPLPIVEVSELENAQTPVSTVAEVYDYIVKDLTDAIEVLPTSYESAPAHHDGIDAYVTKQAAQATLTAVYMSMAGYPLNKGTEYYAKAAEVAKDVVDHNSEYGFYLDSDWSHVYSMGHNYNKETILGIDYNPTVDWGSDSEFTSCDRFESLGDGGWGDAWGEIAFWKRFPEGARKDATYAPKITFQGKDADGKYVITKTCNWYDLNEDGSKVVSEYHPMFCNFTVNCDANGNKLAQPYDYTQPNWTGMCNDHRHRLIRYSELLLWYAESLARSGGDLSTAKSLLRQVRQRACNDVENVTLGDGTTVAIESMSAEQLAEACYIEHGWEVAGYWVAMVTRRSDEFRMNELQKNFDFRVANAEQTIVDATSGKVYKAKESVSVTNSSWLGAESIYIPYPVLEVEKNPNLKDVDRTK